MQFAPRVARWLEPRLGRSEVVGSDGWIGSRGFREIKYMSRKQARKAGAWAIKKYANAFRRLAEMD